MTMHWEAIGHAEWLAIGDGVRWVVRKRGAFFVLYRNGEPFAVRGPRGRLARRWRSDRAARIAAESAA